MQAIAQHLAIWPFDHLAISQLPRAPPRPPRKPARPTRKQERTARERERSLREKERAARSHSPATRSLSLLRVPAPASPAPAHASRVPVRFSRVPARLSRVPVRAPAASPQQPAPKGRRAVATGGAQPASSRAQRNPWTRRAKGEPAPAGQRSARHAEAHPVRRLLLRPFGARKEREGQTLSTGCARPKAASLHPWLQADAPLGRKKVTRQGARPRLLAPTGRRAVATGGAQPASSRAKRNPWRRCAQEMPAPEGQRSAARARPRKRSHIFLRPCRGGFVARTRSTGCAALHPWLQADAPLGHQSGLSRTRTSRRTPRRERGVSAATRI